MKMKSVCLAILLWPLFLTAMTAEEFSTWWLSYRDGNNVPEELRDMVDYFNTNVLKQHSSNYWNHLNHYNIQQIVVYGYQNFKQTVTRNYFTWVVSPNHPYSCNLKKLTNAKVKLPRSQINKTHDFFGAEESKQYNLITELFLNYFLNLKEAYLLKQLEEPLVGNPPYLLYNGKRISQDIFNSLLEFIPVSQNCDLDQFSTIIEIGAGSGRTAYTYIKLLPHVKYIIVDVPPALYISQSYLSDVFPDKKIMKFRPFENFEEIEEEFNQANIVFLMADQITKLPNNCADLFLAVDCLHEMKRKEVEFYFDEAERLAKNLYFKCWQKTVVPFDGHLFDQNSYPVHPTWQVLLEEPCVVPSDFFHALYKLKN